MIEIIIKRTNFLKFSVMGHLCVNGNYICDTMEPKPIDWSKQQKIPGTTAIPEGRYKLVLAPSKKFNRKMPFLLNVPHFSGIMIHTGNVATYPDGTPGDSRGCILVGTDSEHGSLFASRIAFDKLYAILEEADQKAEEMWVTVSSPKKWTYNK